MAELKENVIEFISGEKMAAVTFSQGKYINQLRKLAERFPDQVTIDAENEEGSVFGHVPAAWLRIRPPRSATMSEEEREAVRERLFKAKNRANSVPEALEDDLPFWN